MMHRCLITSLHFTTRNTGTKMAQERENETKIVTPHSLVTEKHVRAALETHKGKEAVLKSWLVEDFTNKGDNYACVVSSVKVKFSIEDKESDEIYIVKLNPCRKMRPFTHILFVKEFKFYSVLAPALDSILESIGYNRLKKPNFYTGCIDDQQEIIFLEDLRRRGFKMVDRKKGMDVQHLELVLEELGKFHASSILFQAKYKSPSDFLSEHDHLEEDLFDFRKSRTYRFESIMNQMINSSISVLESFSGYEKAIAWIESLRSMMGEIFGKLKMSNKCNVICHGDLWNNNILFKYNDSDHPVDMMFLDFQIGRYASPATDLNYLLYTSVEGHIRRPNLNALLSVYYDSFKRILSAGGMDIPFTFEELKDEFRAQNRFGALIGMLIIPIVLFETDNVPDLGNGPQSISKVMKTSIESIATKSEIVKPRFLDMFDEFMEAGVID